MKYDVSIGGISHTVAIERDAQGGASVRLDGDTANVEAVAVGPGIFLIGIDGVVYETHVRSGGAAHDPLLVRCRGMEFRAAVRDPRAWRAHREGAGSGQGQQRVTAPMPSKVVHVLVAEGDRVEAGQGVVVVEAMKMQNEIRASRGGLVERVLVREGDTVAAGKDLIILA